MRAKILLIEDSGDYRQFIHAMLAPFADVDDAATLIEGLDLLRRGSKVEGRMPALDPGPSTLVCPYQAVLLDLGLPDSDCRQSFPAVARVIPAASIVIVSQNDDPEVVADMIRWGAAGYLVKGKDDLDAGHLWSRIKNAISHERIAAKLDETVRQVKETETAIEKKKTDESQT